MRCVQIRARELIGLPRVAVRRTGWRWEVSAGQLDTGSATCQRPKVVSDALYSAAQGKAEDSSGMPQKGGEVIVVSKHYLHQTLVGLKAGKPMASGPPS